MRDIVYEYDGSFDGFLCCVFAGYTQKENPTAFFCGEDPCTLFETRYVETDREAALRVYRSFARQSADFGPFLRRAFLTCMPEKELRMYRLIRAFYARGEALLRDLSDETLLPVRQAVRHLEGECQLLRGFVRFSEFGGILGAEIEPKNRVLPLLRSHFCSRYRDESFFLYDRTHREALLYAAHRARIVPLEHFEMARPDETEAAYRLLWKRFYDTVAIRERENPRCRRTQMPMRYWGTMTEFQGPDHFIPSSPPASPAGGGAPSVPAGISAPGTWQEPGRSVPGSGPCKTAEK